MKNKKLTWILLPVVLGIWAMIGWKVYAALSPEDEENATAIERHDTVPDSVVVPEEYTLALNYRDPFFETRTAPKNNTNPNASVNVKRPEPIVVSSIQWPSLVYSGLVREKQNGRTVGFLTVNGTSYFVKTGDTAGVIIVRKVWSDSLEVTMGKERRIVRR